jgi:outer membrane protein assembly factor BamD (BamD/ComL family)
LEELVLAEQKRKEEKRLADIETKRQKMEAEAAAAWNGIKNTTNPAELQKFIKSFPESPLALNEATQRLGALDAEAKERVKKAQAEAAEARSEWDRIKNTSDTDEVENFIRRHPNTPALTEAKQLLDALVQRAKEREAKQRMEADAAQAWNRIKDTNNQGELRGFIKGFPASALATDAAQRLSTLEREARELREKTQAAEGAAQAAWNNVKNTNDPAELQDFMKRYPDSPHATHDAKVRIEQLEKQAKEREARAKADADAREAKAKAEAAAREAKAKAEAAAREAKERAEAETAQAWDETKDSRDPADFRNFIKRYPNSRFTPVAKQRLADLEPKPDVTTRPDSQEQPVAGRRRNLEPHPTVNASPRRLPPPQRYEPAPRHEREIATPAAKPSHNRVASSRRDEGPPRRHGGGGGGGFSGGYSLPAGGGSSHATTMSGVGF